jgi:Asp-tRNA(Asn)/Glu-tRNA(Gln) amidotransferase C subunit
MKLIGSLVLLLLFKVGFSQEKAESFATAFNEVADIFERNIQESLIKFAEAKFNPDMSPAEKSKAVEAQVYLFKEKVKNLRSESFKQLAKDPEKGNREFIHGYFSFMYGIEFPGLDYRFFEKCNKDLKALTK